jgi:hypothetical protein
MITNDDATIPSLTTSLITTLPIMNDFNYNYNPDLTMTSIYFMVEVGIVVETSSVW